MTEFKLYINDITLKVEKAASLHQWALGKKAYLPVYNGESHSFSIPQTLLSWFFGIQYESEENDNFYLVRGDKSVALTLGSKLAYVDGEEILLDSPPLREDGPTLIPSQLLIDVFGFSYKWGNGALYLQDPVTSAIHKSFQEIYDISHIDGLIFSDLNSDKNPECYITYLRHQNELALAALNTQGKWLADLVTESIHSNGINSIEIGNQRALALNAKDDIPGYQYSLYIFTLEGEIFKLVKKFTTKGYLNSYDNYIEIVTRLDENYKYGSKTLFTWDKEGHYFTEVCSKIVNYVSGEMVVDLSCPREIAATFRVALNYGLVDLVGLLCVENMDYSLGFLLDSPHLFKPDNNEDMLYSDESLKSQDKLILYTYYGLKDITSYQKPIRIMRLVLIKQNTTWKIKCFSSLGDDLPTKINWDDDIPMEILEDKAFSKFPGYQLALNSTSWIRVLCKSEESQPSTRFDISCSYLEFGEMLPGLHISFYHKDSKGQLNEVGQFESYQAQSVHIKNSGDNCYDILISHSLL